MSMDLMEKTFSTQPDYLVAETAEIVTVAKEAATTLKRGVLAVLDSPGKLTAVTVSGSTGNCRTEATGLYSILAEDVKSGEQGVVYLSSEFFVDVLAPPANGSVTNLEAPLRALSIFLK